MRWVLALLLLAPAVSEARVAGADAAGFEVVHEMTVNATPARVWSTLIAPGSWWSPSHSWSGKAENLSLEPRVGGCFCERWEDGSAEHMRVVHVLPSSMLRMTGALGPLQSEAVAGTWTVSLKANGTGTSVTWRYVAAGRFPGGLDRVAPAVDRVLGEQLTRLKAAAERR